MSATDERYDRRIQQLELTIWRQEQELEELKTRRSRRDKALAEIAVWRNDLHSNIEKIVETIDRERPETSWELLRRQLEATQPAIARYVADNGLTLNDVETKICLLMGADLSMAEMARVLNMPEPDICSCLLRIERKFSEQI